MRGAAGEALAGALLSGLLLVAGPAGAAGDAAAPVPDAVLTAGRIYTMDPMGRVVEALAIRDGRITALGSREEILALAGPQTRRIGLADDEAVFPGFTDAHVHLLDGGRSLLGLSLHAAATADEVVALVKAHAEAHPALAVIAGEGWELNLFPGAHPKKELLDAVVPERPVVLIAADGHNAWVNSAALKAAGITKDTPDPPGGRIERDPKTGEPTGTLREAAVALVRAIVPEPTPAEQDAALAAAMAYMNDLGYTAAIDAAVTEGPMEEAFLRYARRSLEPDREHKAPQPGLDLRLCLLPGADIMAGTMTRADIAPVIERLKARRARFDAVGNPAVRADCVKIFVDGVMENFTAAVLEPYRDVPEGVDPEGQLNIPPDVLADHVTAVIAAGFQPHFHALGDRAVRVALDALEAARARLGWAKLAAARPHLAHLELVDPADAPRFAALGATANIQALWAYPDPYITDLTLPHLAPGRVNLLYPFAMLARAGARLAMGSDWPVSTPDPMAAAEVAVRRADPEDDAAAPWLSEQRLGIAEVMTALTRAGAYLMGEEGARGMLAVGSRADLVALTADPFAVNPRELSRIRVRMTMRDGRIVHWLPREEFMPPRPAVPFPPCGQKGDAACRKP